MNKFSIEKKSISSSKSEQTTLEASKRKVKFEIYGDEMIEKIVKSSGNSGRIYLPPNWVGCYVKVIKVD